MAFRELSFYVVYGGGRSAASIGGSESVSFQPRASGPRCVYPDVINILRRLIIVTRDFLTQIHILPHTLAEAYSHMGHFRARARAFWARVGYLNAEWAWIT